MKKVYLSLLAVLSVFASGCESDAAVVEEVIDGTTSSAILRTRNLEGNPYNVFVPGSALSITVEAQNGRPDSDITSVDLFLSFTDNQGDDVDNSVAEQALSSFVPTEFGTSTRGLPTITYNTTLEASATSLGLVTGEYSGGDVFTYRFVINLSDGTSWTNTNGNGNILGGSYFNSPYLYGITVSCIPTGPIAGVYELSMADSFGDGWNGAAIKLTVDGTSTEYTVPDGASGSATITIPADATTWNWEYISGAFDGEVSFTITAPNGDVAIDASNPSAGEIVLSICPD